MITKQQTGILYGNSYKIYELSTSRVFDVEGVSDYYGVTIDYDDVAYNIQDKIGTDFKIIAYPLHELTLEWLRENIQDDIMSFIMDYPGKDGVLETHVVCEIETDIGNTTLTVQEYDKLRKSNFNVDFSPEMCINPKETVK